MRRRYVLVPLLSIILITNIYQDDEKPADKLTVPVNTNESPDYYMEQLNIKLFDDSGQLQAIVNAPVLSHYASQGQAEMNNPDITLYATEEQIWHISSTKGRIVDQTQDIALEEQVTIELGKPNVINLTLNTNNLYYEFEAHRAWNQSLVEFVSAGASGQASGLLIDLNTEVFELHNNVEVRYQH